MSSARRGARHWKGAQEVAKMLSTGAGAADLHSRAALSVWATWGDNSVPGRIQEHNPSTARFLLVSAGLCQVGLSWLLRRRVFGELMQTAQMAEKDPRGQGPAGSLAADAGGDPAPPREQGPQGWADRGCR